MAMEAVLLPTGDLGPLPLERLGHPRCEATPQPGGLTQLALSGELPGDWTVRLTRALASRGISLVEGYARRFPGDLWISLLRLDPGYAAGPLPDFLALATEPWDVPIPWTPRLLDFDLTESAALGGSLQLEVHAWDAIGLLATVLDRAGGAGLHPEELLLETEGECAFHSVVLRGAGGTAPAASARRRLARELQRLLG